MRTVVVYLLAIGALVVGAVYGLPELLGIGGASDELVVESEGGAPPVVVAEVRRAPFVDRLDALGTVRANESVEITPNRADHVAAVHFEDGQNVEAGQLLVEMHAEEERAALAEAIAVQDERRANHERAKELWDQSMLSDRELDAARTLQAAAEARVVALRAAIGDREVRAPFAGVLGLRRISVGAYVDPSTVITTLDDLATVKLDFTIPETWLAAVRPGMAVRTTSAAWPGVDFAGEIATVDTRLDPRTRSATVRALLPNPELALRPGMLLEVVIERGEEPVLQVPEAAVIPNGAEHYVLAVDDDAVAHRVLVEVGRRRPGAVEIVAGLAEGDRVVVEGVVRVRPDHAVDVVASRETRP